MNIFKGIAPFALAVAFVFGATSIATAGLGYKVSAATVDDVTTSACVTASGQKIDGFFQGVSADQVWALQKEVGSKGSGTWQTVGGFSDVFPTAVGSSNAAVQVLRYEHSDPGPACYRLKMTTDGGGTAQVQLVTNQGTPPAYDSSTSWRMFDDFHAGVLPITTGHATPSYIVHIGSGSNAVLSVIEGQPEGVMTLSSGDDGNDNDLSTGSLGLLTNGALISTGDTYFEVRLHMSQITDTRMGMGLVDVISNATEIEPFEANSNVVAEGAVTTVVNAAAFGFDTDAESDTWQLYSNNANTQGNVADEYATGTAPAVTTYQTFGIHITSVGDVFYYLEGVLRGAEPLGVATTAVLIPYWWAGTADDATGTVNKVNVDYIEFWSPRPTS